jgi:small subunit ribosomal protein S9
METLNKENKNLQYYQAVGRRKTASATVLLYPNNKKLEIVINDKPFDQYFPTPFLQKVVISPFEVIGGENKFKVIARVHGGGKNSQAEAIRHGISRALVLYNEEWKKILKQAGFLKRDPRMKERKKPGLKRARRAPQWQKR